MLYDVIVGMSKKERKGRPSNASAVCRSALYVLVNGEVIVLNMPRATDGGGGHAIAFGR